MKMIYLLYKRYYNPHLDIKVGTLLLGAFSTSELASDYIDKNGGWSLYTVQAVPIDLGITKNLVTGENMPM